MNGMNADEDTDEENENSLKAKGFWYYLTSTDNNEGKFRGQARKRYNNYVNRIAKNVS